MFITIKTKRGAVKTLNFADVTAVSYHAPSEKEEKIQNLATGEIYNQKALYAECQFTLSNGGTRTVTNSISDSKWEVASADEVVKVYESWLAFAVPQAIV